MTSLKSQDIFKMSRFNMIFQMLKTKMSTEFHIENTLSNESCKLRKLKVGTTKIIVAVDLLYYIRSVNVINNWRGLRSIPLLNLLRYKFLELTSSFCQPHFFIAACVVYLYSIVEVKRKRE